MAVLCVYAGVGATNVYQYLCHCIVVARVCYVAAHGCGTAARSRCEGQAEMTQPYWLYTNVNIPPIHTLPDVLFWL